MNAPHNPLAFPQPEIEGVTVHTGMTLRDYFAGQALSAVTERVFADPATKGMLASEVTGLISQVSYDIADAMLAERAKGGDA